MENTKVLQKTIIKCIQQEFPENLGVCKNIE